MIMGKHHPFFISPAFDVMSLKLLCRIQVNKGRNNIVNKISYQVFDLDTCKCNLRNSCFPETLVDIQTP